MLPLFVILLQNTQQLTQLCMQKGHCRVCNRSCMTDGVKETSLVLI